MRALKVMALLGCTTLSGCLEIEHTVTLLVDGSGTQEVRMVMRERMLTELRKSQPAARLGERGDPTAVFDEEKVRGELTEAGLTLTAHKVAKTSMQRTVNLTAGFADFQVLQQSPLTGSSAEWQLEKGPKPGLAKLTLYPQGQIAWREARDKAAKMVEQADPVAEQFFQKRQQQLAGLDVVVRFKLPGDVLVWTRNMKKTGDREVTARVTADQIKTPKDLVRRLAPRFQVIFDARGTKLLR